MLRKPPAWTASIRICPDPGFVQRHACWALRFFYPQGHWFHEIELEACDTDAVSQVTATLVVVANNESSATEVAVAATGGTPGCNLFSSLLAPPIAIDNLFNSYFVEVTNGGGTTDAVRFQAVRVFYNLQVSPAPATATFADVSTVHPFFRFIEALASSGITGGCGAGNYCPDFPVTRGQMAVFLSTALGLHFPD